MADVAEGAGNGLEAAAERLVNTAKMDNPEGWSDTVVVFEQRCGAMGY